MDKPKGERALWDRKSQSRSSNFELVASRVRSIMEDKSYGTASITVPQALEAMQAAWSNQTKKQKQTKHTTKEKLRKG